MWLESGFACGCSTRLEWGVWENTDFPHAKIVISMCGRLSRPQGKITNGNKKKIKNTVTVVVVRAVASDGFGLPAVAGDGSPPLRSPATDPPPPPGGRQRIRPPRGGRWWIRSAATTIANGRLRRPSRDHRRRRRRWEKWEEEADRGRKEWEEEADREGGVGVGAEREMGGENGCGAIWEGEGRR